jgi:hypothetical protein
MAHRSYSGPPKTFSPLFSLLCPWIHGLFPAIEFAVVPSPSLPNFGDPGATLARASLNSGDLTAVERSGTAHSLLFPPGLIPSIRFRSNDSDPRSRLFPPGLIPSVQFRSNGSNPRSRLFPPGLIPSVRFKSNGSDRG